tara:strand:+ start:351 stop:593 length:243 start_codon:yes stop_codon:yes gene_type:complete
MEVTSSGTIERLDIGEEEVDLGLTPRTDTSAGGVGNPFGPKPMNRDDALREADRIIEGLGLSYERNAGILRTLDRIASRL